MSIYDGLPNDETRGVRFIAVGSRR